jgi:hypothetical protein
MARRSSRSARSSRGNDGPLGWNCLYEWTKGDVDISRKHFNLFLSTGDTIPFRTLGFLAGESNYVGCATVGRC